MRLLQSVPQAVFPEGFHVSGRKLTVEFLGVDTWGVFEVWRAGGSAFGGWGFGETAPYRNGSARLERRRRVGAASSSPELAAAASSPSTWAVRCLPRLMEAREVREERLQPYGSNRRCWDAVSTKSGSPSVSTKPMVGIPKDRAHAARAIRG